MKYLKSYKLFENNEEIKIGWRCQNQETLLPTIGENATEGEGFYLFDNKKDAEDWGGKYIFEVKYKTPKKEIHVEFLGSHNSFLFWGEGKSLYKPVKPKDSEWNKLAIKFGGDDLNKCIKEFTRLLIEAGYDAVIIDDEPYWTVLLDSSLIVSSTVTEDTNYKPRTYTIGDESFEL